MGERRSPAVTSPPSLDAAPSILYPGLAGRLRRRGAYGWARGAGRSTVDLGDTSTTTNPVTQTLTEQPGYRQPQKLCFAETEPSGTRSPKVISDSLHNFACGRATVSWTHLPPLSHRQTLQSPLNGGVFLHLHSRTHTPTNSSYTHRLTPRFSKVSLVKLPSHEVYQANESRDNIKTHKKNAYEKF